MRRPRAVASVAGVGALALVLTACGGGGTSGGSGGAGADELTFLGLNENETIAATLTALSEDECAAENEAQPLTVTQQSQETLDQQLQLLAGQDSLPQLFTSANAPALNTELFEADSTVDLGTALDELGVADGIVPAARSVVEQLYDGTMIVLPTELNIEGLWYNEQLLEENGIEVPTTWDELVEAFATLQAAGVQPVSQAGSGGDGWGITRWVGNYLLRDLGPEALQAVRDGDAELTDPEYVAAAQAVSDLGAEGYFGPSPTSIDYATALNTFLAGDAGFIYMGSWALAAFNDPEQNLIGEDAIGFLPFPEVEGGAGSADQMPANVGTAVSVSAAGYEDEATQAWVRCVVENYGTVALRDSGQITGFTVGEDVEVPALSQLVQDQIAAVDESVLWFEGYFSAAATTTSQTNGGLLGAGQLSGEEFMTLVQADLG
ncbi:ABC transporter substrate-binding protein [Cellulomonas sp. NS3]|uniref:ABC transporter substrate-binding protein n=1 Tax=Cellulomonas sp. NS3 TaxID=2973977 RepID=UPI0021623A36|nr:extracellular solute-binding protein [Cellulomonas sp. NS3]